MPVKDALELAKKNKVEIVDLKFVDFPGLWQHFFIPATELNAELFEEGLGFDGSSIRGFQSINESDMRQTHRRRRPLSRSLPSRPKNPSGQGGSA